MQHNLQADTVIGVIGSVSNGKSCVVKSITGTTTQRHAKEKQTNRTIRVGYANAKLFKCSECSSPSCYKSVKPTDNKCVCDTCGKECEFQKHVSFTDVPGHNLFMSTMLNGTCAMDYAIMIESCQNTEIPSQQTIEHYNILRQKGISTILVCLNKVDQMVKTPKKVKQIMEKLRKYIYDAEGVIVPIIPISATLNCNIDIVREYICRIQLPQKDITSHPKLFSIRSFNVNLPKTQLENLKGGVMGGCLQRGILNVGENMILSPCYTEKLSSVEQNDTGINWKYTEVKCKILSIDSEQIELSHAIPGGLIGVQLDIDPALTANDGLVGHILYKECEKNKYRVYEGIKITYNKIRDIPIKSGDVLQVNINANNIRCTVFEIDDIFIRLDLESPVCVEIGDTVTVSTSSAGGGINVYASGKIVDGIESMENK
jgi:translation initiation factor 2 subunit 3